MDKPIFLDPPRCVVVVIKEGDERGKTVTLTYLADSVYPSEKPDHHLRLSLQGKMLAEHKNKTLVAWYISDQKKISIPEAGPLFPSG